MKIPLTQKELKKMKVGELVHLNGTIYTARDTAHEFLTTNKKSPINLEGAVIYHCGPIVKLVKGEFKIIAAGPTTSTRIEPFLEKLIKKHRISAMIGKGGLSKEAHKTIKGKVVYFCTPGGIASLLAQHIVKVKEVYKLKELGKVEAIWALEVKDFPVIVAIDLKGQSLYI